MKSELDAEVDARRPRPTLADVIQSDLQFPRPRGKWQMELRHLRYFIAVAEELNFTRAAERLGINQPPLSQQIRQLEKGLGTQLFRRRTRGVELTDAGKLMLEEARVILRQVETAKTGVERRARGETGRINIGSSGGTYFHPLITAVIREYRMRYPDVVMFPQASNTSLLVARLLAGQIDVAFVRPPISNSEGLALDMLVDEPAVMALPIGHPLSRSKSAPLGAFAKDTFVLYPRELNPGNYDSIIAACRRAGFSPKLGQEAPQIVAVVPLVAAGLGVSIVPKSTSQMLCDDAIAYVPIEGAAPRALIGLAYRRNDHSPAVQNFVTVARGAMQTAQNEAGAKRNR
jgi:DNA-binding transcriptional LysR family regulator